MVNSENKERMDINVAVTQVTGIASSRLSKILKSKSYAKICICHSELSEGFINFFTEFRMTNTFFIMFHNIKFQHPS